MDYSSIKKIDNIMRNAIDNSPSEFYLIDKQGVIHYLNNKAAENAGIDQSSTQKVSLLKINPAATESWWNNIVDKVEKDKSVKLNSSHIAWDNREYPVLINIYKTKDNGCNFYCYYCIELNDLNKLENNLLRESKINKSLAEIGHELTKHNKLYSVELLIRQYALKITQSTFSFIIYRDPVTQRKKITVYSDSSTSYKTEIDRIEKCIKEGCPGNSEQEGNDQYRHTDIVINNPEKYFIESKEPISKLIPLKRFASAGIFFHSSYEGLIMVGGKESDYNEKDIDNLKSLSNLFALAINRIQENNKLMESIDKLQMAINAANMTILDIEPLNNKAHINGQWTSIIGVPIKEQKIDLSLLVEKIHKEDIENIKNKIREHRNSNSPFFKLKYRIKIKNNTYRWVETTGQVTNLNSKGEIERVVGVAVDITDSIKLNKELIKSKEEAVAANKAKNMFLARISHEIRTPLNAIIGFADLLEKNSQDKYQLDYLKGIKKSGISLLQLISDILNYSKIEAGKLALNKKSVNINNLIKEIKMLFKSAIKEKDIEFKFYLDEMIPKYLIIDELHLRQILTNLLSNAIKFTDKGYISLSIKCDNLTQTKTDLVIKVEDTGIGIKPESQKTIFEDFTQQENQDSRRYGGTGLGLGIVKQLVELMKGSISLHSITGKGSIFKITLPDCEINKESKNEINNKDHNKSKYIKPIIKSKTDSVNKTASNQTLKEFNDNLKEEWLKFRVRPSFNNVDNIVKSLEEIAEKNNDNLIKKKILSIKDAKASFDVEKLNEILEFLSKYFSID
ncbi:ATP-binding protein [Marinilabiliaceae bacterium ANBcel2]|nr:ATP-binding protein [Marinilabiliaceae bacterium ANBcel2]